jgi:hypothetical protein
VTSSEANIAIHIVKYLLVFGFLAGLVVESSKMFERYLAHEKEMQMMRVEACIKMNCLSPVPSLEGLKR